MPSCTPQGYKLPHARWGSSSYFIRPDFRITAFPVHASRPMASGQDHNWHGETEPVGFQAVQTLLFADEYARRTVGLPSPPHVPDIAAALRAVQTILSKLEVKLEVKMIEFLAEWEVTFLIPATHVLEVRAPHLSFKLLKEYCFRELYLGLKVTASFDRSESYQATEPAGHLERAVYHSVCAEKASKA